MQIKHYTGSPQRKCIRIVRKGPNYKPEHARCCRFTKYLINGQPYCHQHAGETALGYLIAHPLTATTNQRGSNEQPQE